MPCVSRHLWAISQIGWAVSRLVEGVGMEAWWVVVMRRVSALRARRRFDLRTISTGVWGVERDEGCVRRWEWG